MTNLPPPLGAAVSLLLLGSIAAISLLLLGSNADVDAPAVVADDSTAVVVAAAIDSID